MKCVLEWYGKNRERNGRKDSVTKRRSSDGELSGVKPAGIAASPGSSGLTTVVCKGRAKRSRGADPSRHWLASKNTYVPGRASVTPSTNGAESHPGVEPTETTGPSMHAARLGSTAATSHEPAATPAFLTASRPPRIAAHWPS